MVLPKTYPDAVARAGGVPVLLPPVGTGHRTGRSPGRPDAVRRRRRRPGPLRPAAAHPETVGLGQDRDDFEFGLLGAALGRGLPMLAVCRGMQVLNSALGGTLRQHLPEKVGHDGHRPELGVFGEREVRITEGTRTGRHPRAPRRRSAATTTRHWPPSAAGLTVVATADDGTVEAVEAGHGFVLGVQWHPEQDPARPPGRRAGRRGSQRSDDPRR